MNKNDILSGVLEKARQMPQRIALPEATDPNILQAAALLVERGWGVPVLVGEPAAVREAAASCGVNLNGMEIEDCTSAERLRALVAAEHERKFYFSEEMLAERAADPLSYAMMMLDVSWADCVFAGVVYSTNDVLLASNLFVGLRPGVKTPFSMSIHYCPGLAGDPDRIFAIGDASTCVKPDAGMLAEIAIGYCDCVQGLFGWDARCAMLSFSTCGSNDHEEAERVRQAVAIAQEKRPDLKIDGEFQLDAAVNPRVAARKVKRDSAVAGRANVLVFPDINAANIGYKLMQEFGHTEPVCLIIQGFAKPVGDCSRGDTPELLATNMATLAARAAMGV